MTPSEFRLIRTDDLAMNQTTLGKLLGVSKETVGNIERGYDVPLVYQLAVKQLVWQHRVQPLLETLK